jgi:hypothetical protein
MVRKGTHHLWDAFDVIERWITLAQFIQLPRRVAYCNRSQLATVLGPQRVRH